MKPTPDEFEQIKQELLVLQKKIELAEEKARLREMKDKNKKIENTKWTYHQPLPKEYSESEGDTVRINFNTDLKTNRYYTDNMNRSSFYEVN